jgi:signal transduction histidine kinase/DNA-binding response OmpR family regulator
VKKILIIDDNEHLVLYVGKKLRDAGHEVVTVLNGMSALKTLADYGPDIIFCDYFLPNLNGDKLCRIIRRMDHVKDKYLVIMSAAASELNLDPASVGADALIAKGSFKETEKHFFAAIEAAESRQSGGQGLGTMGMDTVFPRRMTKELLEKKRHLQDILDSISEGIVEICCERIVYANPTTLRIFKKTQDQLLAVPFSTLFDERARIQVEALIKSGSDNIEAIDKISPEHRDDLILSMKRLPFQGDSDTIILLIADITKRMQAEQSIHDYQEHLEALVEERTSDLKRANETLQQVQKLEAIGTLAGGIAHDFNNMLSAMIGYMELAQIDEQEDRKRRYINQALEVSNRAKEIINQILIFSRHQEQERKPVLVAPIIKGEIKLLKSLLPSTIKIIHTITDTSAMILADVTQIQQVLMNLCTNAFHAMREQGGVLEIGLDRERVDQGHAPHPLNLSVGDYLRLSVRDTGHGIDAANISRIFDPFFTTKAPGEGTGLGLSVVYGIVRDHNGAIGVDSEPGKGTTISIYLPLIDTGKVDQLQAPEKIAGGSERILLVDDEAAIVEVVESMISSLGYRVTARRSSVETLNLFRTRPDDFDLVITDMTMPGIRGDDLAREMLKIRADIPIILCTGFSEMITEEKTKGIGIRRFIMKPLYLKDLAKVIREALE